MGIKKVQTKDNAFKGYSCKGAYFVDFEDRYAIDGRLLGRQIGFSYKDCYMVIVMPSVIKKNGIPHLAIPKLLESYGVDVDT